MLKPLLLIGLILTSFSLFGKAEKQKSNFEWGIGLFSLRAPHYRGSDQSKNYFWPVPHFSYKSELIEAEPSFITGTFFESERISIKLSLLAGLRVESEDNTAREGMPDLDYTLEIGPMMIVRLWESDDESHALTLNVPIRQVIASDLTFVQNVGFFTVPFLNWLARPQELTYNWRSNLSIAAMFATRRNHDYYYSVAPDFVKAERPQFAAKGGYSGTQLTWILNRRFGHFQLLGFARYDFLNGVAFEDSPLFKKDHYTVFGLSTAWIF